MDWFIPGIILGVIIAFIAFRMLGKKVLTPKKSVKSEAINNSKQIHHNQGIDKRSGILITIAFWIISVILVFVGLGFVAITHSSQQNEVMFFLFALFGLASFITGIIFLVKGFRAKKGKKTE